MLNKIKDWITISYDETEEPLVRYDPLRDERVNMVSGEVIELELKQILESY